MYYDPEYSLLRMTPQDVLRHQVCPRNAALDLDVALGRRPAPPRAGLAVYARAAVRHREAMGRQIEAEFPDSGRMITPAVTTAELHKAAAETRDAMALGAQAIMNATLWWQITDAIALHATVDALVRTDEGLYEPWISTLATRVRGKHRRIAALTTVLLNATTQSAAATAMVLLGSGVRERMNTDESKEDSTATIQLWVDDLTTRLAQVEPTPSAHHQPACRGCRFLTECQSIWEQADALSLVAGIGPSTSAAYTAAGFATMAALAAADPTCPPADIEAGHWARDVAQARLQHRAITSGIVPIELTDRTALTTLTPPRGYDLYFDIEGYGVPPHSIDYLYGLWDGQVFTCFWAHGRTEELELLDEFLDDIARRRREHPDLRIYHFNHYEPQALTRLAQRVGKREAEVAEICANVLVDLLPIVRTSIQAGVPGYGLKQLEPLHGFTRTNALQNAAESLEYYDRWLHDGHDPRLLDSIAAYNLEDLRSTASLHEWLSRL